MENEKRLIDANSSLERVREQGREHPNAYDLIAYAMCILQEAPTVDAVEVAHGRWIETKEEVWHLYERRIITRFKCSQCEQTEAKKSSYCPNCGAKMELEVK